MNLIDVKNLLFKYKMYSGEKEEVIEHTAIDNISLSIKKGDFVGILGHNGSGKSTLAKQLAALLKPSGGIIYVGGMDIPFNLTKGRSLGFASTPSDSTPCSDSLSLRLRISRCLTLPEKVTRRFIMQKARRHCLRSSDRL